MGTQRVVMVASVVMTIAIFPGCGESGIATEPVQESGEQQGNWLLASAPSESVGIIAAKAGAQEGDPISLRGIIGGRVDAMSNESAVFVMIDDSIDNPCTTGDDHCATPWDYCCTERKEIQASSATVQLVDAQGHTIAGDLRTHGISPLDAVVVVGVVGPRPSEDVLTVRATGIYKDSGS